MRMRIAMRAAITFARFMVANMDRVARRVNGNPLYDTIGGRSLLLIAYRLLLVCLLVNPQSRP
jgi:hypothetical protein